MSEHLFKTNKNSIFYFILFVRALPHVALKLSSVPHSKPHSRRRRRPPTTSSPPRESLNLSHRVAQAVTARYVRFHTFIHKPSQNLPRQNSNHHQPHFHHHNHFQTKQIQNPNHDSRFNDA